MFQKCVDNKQSILRKNPPWEKGILFPFLEWFMWVLSIEYAEEVERKQYEEDKENKNKARCLGIFKITLFTIGLIWALKTWEAMTV